MRYDQGNTNFPVFPFIAYKNYKNTRIRKNADFIQEDTGSESQISDVQASCSYFLSTTGQPRKEPQIPTSGSLRKSPSWWWGEEGWVEEWRRDSWRGRKARTMWERLAGWGVGSAGRFSSFLMENLDPVWKAVEREAILSSHSA